MFDFEKISHYIDLLVDDANNIYKNRFAILFFLSVIICVNIIVYVSVLAWNSQNTIASQVLSQIISDKARSIQIQDLLTPESQPYLFNNSELRTDKLEKINQQLDQTRRSLRSDRVIVNVYKSKYRQVIAQSVDYSVDPIPFAYWMVSTSTPGYRKRIETLREGDCISVSDFSNTESGWIWQNDFSVKFNISCPIPGYGYIAVDYGVNPLTRPKEEIEQELQSVSTIILSIFEED